MHSGYDPDGKLTCKIQLLKVMQKRQKYLIVDVCRWVGVMHMGNECWRGHQVWGEGDPMGS